MMPTPDRFQLTVIITDTAPVRFLNEPCGHRTVHLDLTDEQLTALARGEFEVYGSTFLEPAAKGGKP